MEKVLRPASLTYTSGIHLAHVSHPDQSDRDCGG